MNQPRVALVTGSGKRRIGWHVADALAARGYSLVVHYRSSRAEAAETVAALEARGTKAVGLQADLTDEHAVRGLVDQTLAHFGRVDVLVNCAATWLGKRLEDVTAADVRHEFDTNTLGTFLCSQGVGLAWPASARGAASSPSATGPSPGLT
jgi:pteridine reductase